MAEAIIETVHPLTTEDGNMQTLSAYTVPEDHTAGFIWFFVVAHKAAVNGVYGGHVYASFRRTTTGNVAVSAVKRRSKDDGGTAPASSFTVDASGNDVRLRVAGATGETWNWAAERRVFNED